MLQISDYHKNLLQEIVGEFRWHPDDYLIVRPELLEDFLDNVCWECGPENCVCDYEFSGDCRCVCHTIEEED